MRPFGSVLFCLLLGAANCDYALAKCTFDHGGYPYVVLHAGTGSLTATLSVDSPDCYQEGLGYHMTARVICHDSNQNLAVADVWLGATSDLSNSHQPAVSGSGRLFFPWYETRYDRAVLRQGPLEIVVDGLRGSWTRQEAYLGAAVSHDVFDVRATDGCVQLTMRVEATSSQSDVALPIVDELFHSVRITKMPGSVGALWHPDPPALGKMTFDDFRAALGLARGGGPR